jgi:hypothetical protein
MVRVRDLLGKENTTVRTIAAHTVVVELLNTGYLYTQRQCVLVASKMVENKCV